MSLQNEITLDIIREKEFEALISIFKHEKVSETYMVPDLTCAEMELRLFSRIRDLSENGEKFVRGIFLGNNLIGIINEVGKQGGEIELGYAIHPNYFGQGYMTRALHIAITHLFSNGIYEVLAGAFEENFPSIRVMQKCGMILHEKTEIIEYRGKQHNCIYYSIKKQ